MEQLKLNQKAKDIIAQNIYLTLSTMGDKPWAAPLFYCTDQEYNFYFISQPDALHSKHIIDNPHVAFAIFDSHAPEGSGNGVQASGTVTLLETETEIIEGLKYYHTTFIDCTPKDFVGDKPYRLFKLTPDEFYILDPNADVDKRVRVLS